MTYLIGFIGTYFLGRLADRESHGVALRHIVSLMPICLIAGLRSMTVGTDVQVYVSPMFEAAQWMSFDTLLFERYGGAAEPLFVAYVYVITRVFDSFGVLLFLIELAVVAPFAYALIKIAPNSFGSGLLLFTLVFFGFSLNVMRQSIAMSILCVALVFAINGNGVKFFVALAVAAGFHLTALLGVVIWPLCRCFLSCRRSATSLSAPVLCGLTVFACFVLTIEVVLLDEQLLQLAGGVKASYASQVEYSKGGGLSLSVLTLSFTPLLLLFFISRNKEKDQLSLLFALSTLGAVGGLLCQLSMISSQMSRVGMMFIPFTLLASALILSLETDGSERRLSQTVIFAVSAMYFAVVYVYGNSGDIFPYSSPAIPWLG